MKRLELKPDGFKCTLAECPPGLFLLDDENIVGLKSDYDEYYLAIDGDAFWGGTSSKEERAKIVVQPLRYEWVEAEAYDAAKNRIKDLEAQLAEANAVAEWYGDKSNWEETWCDFGDDGRDGDVPARIDFEDCEVCEDESGMYLGPAGKRARQYLEKWKVGK